MATQTDKRIAELESMAKGAFERRDWPACRAYLQQAIDECPMQPLQKVEMLRNICATYDEEGDKEHGLEVANQALAIIAEHNLNETSDKGAILRGWLRAKVVRFEGTGAGTVSTAYYGPLIGAYTMGAGMGTAFGSLKVVTTQNIHGVVKTDLRYGGAVVGAILGLFLLLRALTQYPVLALVLSVPSAWMTAQFLLRDDPKKGMFIIVTLLIVPIFLSAIGIQRILQRTGPK